MPPRGLTLRLILLLALLVSGCASSAPADATIEQDRVNANALTLTSAGLQVVGPLPWWPTLLKPREAAAEAPGTITFAPSASVIAPNLVAPDYPYGAGTTRFSMEIPCSVANAPAALSLAVVDSAMHLVIRERSSGAAVEASSGWLATVVGEGRAERRREVIALPAPARCEGSAVYDVHWNISNQHVSSFGPWIAPKVSSLAVAQASFAAEFGTSLFLIGGLLMVAAYHLGLWFVRRRERAPLTMAVFAILLASRVATVRHVTGILVPFFDNFRFLGPIEIATIPLLSMVFEQLLHEVVAPGIPEPVRRFFKVTQALLFLAVLPSGIVFIWAVLLPLVQLVAVVSVFVTTGYLARKVARNADADTLIVASGFVVLTGAFVAEVLDQRRIIVAPGVASYAQLFLVFSQAFVIAKQNAEARRSAEILSSELRVMNLELSEAARLRDDFVSNVSHELRTPVHGIVGLAEGMSEDPQMPEVFAHRMQQVMASGVRLRTLVDALLDFAKRGADELRFEKVPVDLAAVVAECIQEFPGRQLRASVPVHWKLEAVPSIDADQTRIKRLVHALLGNAVKFVENGSITLTLTRTAQGAELRITDTGPGLPAVVRKHLFEPFIQGERSDARTHGGAGLGLALAKKVVAIHGGSIELTDGPQGGTRVTILLPFAAAKSSVCAESEGTRVGALALSDAEPSATLSPPSFGEISLASPLSDALTALSSAPSGGRILVVDDEPINREVLRQQLSTIGYEVAEAAGGRQALDALVNGLAPDLILLDVMMPEMSGYDVLEEIRKTSAESALPVVLLTAKNREQDVVRGFSLGASDYITKPFSKAELLARVGHHLRLVLMLRHLGEQLLAHEKLVGTIENLRALRVRETGELRQLRLEVARVREDVKTLRGHLLQGEKLAALGQLVAGVAHELNNPISYIGQAQESLHEFFETLSRRLERGDDAKALAGVKQDATGMLELAGYVGTGATRIRDICSALRNFARTDMELTDDVDLADLAGEAMVMLKKRLTRHTVRVATEGAPRIRCHRSHVGQVIVNFLSNAGDELDACVAERGHAFDGQILLSATPVHRGRDGVLIAIEDSGRGVPVELREKIFESFFTTKPAGKGTGLGLAICTEIARDHEGTVHVGVSTLLGGASFELWIPLDGPAQIGPPSAS